MTVDRPSLDAALHGTILSNRQPLKLRIDGSTEHAWAVRIDANEVLPAWRAARAVIDRTGRWPVAVTAFGATARDWHVQIEEADLLSRFYFKEPAPEEDVSPWALIARAVHVDLQGFLDRCKAGFLAHWPFGEVCGEEPGPSPGPTEAPGSAGDGLGPAPGQVPIRSESELDRWLSDWKLRLAAGPAPAGRRDPLDWFEPTDAVTLLLLPIPDSWNSLAYLHWYAAVGSPAESYIALLHAWNERYGAELVAHYGTMLQFVVSRPPSTPREAWDLALEQASVAPCTLVLPGVFLREHAMGLLGATDWFLHERP